MWIIDFDDYVTRNYSSQDIAAGAMGITKTQLQYIIRQDRHKVNTQTGQVFREVLVGGKKLDTPHNLNTKIKFTIT